jgi:hypothetical protein
MKGQRLILSIIKLFTSKNRGNFNFEAQMGECLYNFFRSIFEIKKYQSFRHGGQESIPSYKYNSYNDASLLVSVRCLIIYLLVFQFKKHLMKN